MKTTIFISRKLPGILFFVLLFLFTFCNTITAQQKITGEVSKTYQVTMTDGSVIAGKLVSSTATEIVIQSGTMGEVKIQREKIKTMVEVSSINDKVSGVWFPNPNPNKYLIGNSAIPMEKKSGYYQNTWIFVNNFSYAFTDFLSVTAGFEIISIMAKGNGPYVFFINPKVSFKIADNFYAGGNILYVNTIRTVTEFGGLATLNGFCTYGNKNTNLTAALGWGWADGNFSSRPLITISGMARASKRIAFVSENWVVPGVGDGSNYYGIFSYGIRFLGEKTSIDLAFVNNPDIAKNIVIGIPWLDFVINF